MFYHVRTCACLFFFFVFLTRVWFGGLCFYDVDDGELMSQVSFFSLCDL